MPTTTIKGTAKPSFSEIILQQRDCRLVGTRIWLGCVGYYGLVDGHQILGMMGCDQTRADNNQTQPQYTQHAHTIHSFQLCQVHSPESGHRQTQNCTLFLPRLLLITISQGNVSHNLFLRRRGGGGLSGVANPNRLQLFEIQSVYLAVVSFSLHRVYYLIYNSNPIQTRTLNVYCWRCGWDIGFVKHILKSFNNLIKD